jgi:hypothetical protein
MDTSGLARRVTYFGTAAVLAACLAGCSSMPFGGSGSPPPAPEPMVEPEMAPSIRPEELVGRYGLASYHKPEDKMRTEAQARGQCKQPYVIGPGTSGGIMMHLADEPTPQELRVKGSRSGKNYIGPPGPPGGERDREIISFDGRVLVMRFLDKDTDTRYGVMVYVRCGPKA